MNILNKIKNLPLKKKLIYLIMSVSIFTLLTGTTFIIISDMMLFRKDLVNETVVTAKLIGDYSVAPLTFEDTESAREVLSKLESIPSIKLAVIYNTDGRVFSVYTKNKDGAETRIPENPASLRPAEFKSGFLHVCQPIIYKDSSYGAIYIRSSLRDLYNKIFAYLITIVVIISAIVAASVFLAVRLQRFISIPILNLSDVMKEISERRDFSMRVIKESDDEIGNLYEGFNLMLDQIHAHDIMRDKAEEEMKIAKDAAESANRAKSDFLANMSHELRTPLNSINGIVELLRFGSFDKDEVIVFGIRQMMKILEKTNSEKPNKGIASIITKLDSVMQYLSEDGNLKRYFFKAVRGEMESLNLIGNPDLNATMENIIGLVDAEEKGKIDSYKRIKEAGDYLLGIIDSILNLSKIETGKIDVNKTSVNMKELIDSVIVNAKSFAKTKGKENIRMDYIIEKLVPDRMMLDNQKVRQALLSILSNAINFTESGSIDLAVRREDESIKFSVTDTGIGIKQEDKSRIFMEFERAQSATRIEGTGLGLAITRRLVEVQGGSVGFESEFGKGSTFWFTMPV